MWRKERHWEASRSVCLAQVEGVETARETVSTRWEERTEPQKLSSDLHNTCCNLTWVCSHSHTNTSDDANTHNSNREFKMGSSHVAQAGLELLVPCFRSSWGFKMPLCPAILYLPLWDGGENENRGDVTFQPQLCPEQLPTSYQKRREEMCVFSSSQGALHKVMQRPFVMTWCPTRCKRSI